MQFLRLAGQICASSRAEMSRRRCAARLKRCEVALKVNLLLDRNAGRLADQRAGDVPLSQGADRR